jgi:ABC-type Fe3+/spermidine/putrescine transport system ATPase subunit
LILQLHDVSKQFGAVRAVDGLDLEVRRGEILTLLGPSGCGKTTTLRTIIGLERCDSGEIIYDGRVIDSPQTRTFVPTHKRQMGMVFQSYAIWPHMNVFDNVGYPLRVRGVGGHRLHEAVERVLEQVGLSVPRRSLAGASSSASRWHGVWCSSRRSCCWTSPSATSMRDCAVTCARSSKSCSDGSE